MPINILLRCSPETFLMILTFREYSKSPQDGIPRVQILFLSPECAHAVPDLLLSPALLHLSGAHTFLSPSAGPRCVFFAFLSPQHQGPFSCLYNLFPETTLPSWFTFSMVHSFYLCDILKNLLLLFESWL